MLKRNNKLHLCKSIPWYVHYGLYYTVVKNFYEKITSKVYTFLLFYSILFYFASILLLIRKSYSYYNHSNPILYENLTIVKTLCQCHRARNREVVLYTEFYLQIFQIFYRANQRNCETSLIRETMKRTEHPPKKANITMKKANTIQKKANIFIERPTCYSKINRCLI